jgi:beta-glucosidase
MWMTITGSEQRPQRGAPIAQRVDERSPDERARQVEQLMTDDERLSLIYSLMPVALTSTGHVREPRVPRDVPPCAGWVAGVPRLGVPPLLVTDAELGGREATALPSPLALGATFDPSLARACGALVGREARANGFNVVCGCALDLPRDPRCGRNFASLSEDPWHAAVMAAETVLGTQSEGVIAVLEHLSLSSYETNKLWLDAVLEDDEHREAELLAFEIAIERAAPGALKAGYHKLNGAHCCGHHVLLEDTVKDTFGFKGWIMSDRKAVHGWEYALQGLDQQSGAQLDEQEWFVGPLRKAYAEGKLPRERLSEMVRRILRSMFAVGVDRWGVAEQGRGRDDINATAHDAVALEVARRGIVLLHNDDTLPLSPHVRTVALIGGDGRLGAPRRHQASPLPELRKLLPRASVTCDPGAYPAEAAALARRCDAAIVVATRFESEGRDAPDLSLPYGQDALVDAVADANPNTIVVLETGNPVAMPWLDKVGAVLVAWYPGQAGARAIAEVLTGETNPSGRLPITFPESVVQLPRPELAGFGTPVGTPLTIHYTEGADVGYRWLARTEEMPLFAFGHGLSYTTFSYSDLDLEGGHTITASFTVTNIGDWEGADVPQVYLIEAAGERRMRLLGFERVRLRPGQSQRVSITADPRLVARFDGAINRWQIAGGTYAVAVGKSAGDIALATTTTLTARRFGS